MHGIGIGTSVGQGEELVATEVDGEVVMLSIENGKYYGLDKIGSQVWNLIAEPKQVKDLVDILTDEYDIDREICLLDILELLYRLYDEGLIRIA